MKIIGLTGSIGMGKTTTASFFKAEGVPVHDSDECVHRLYAGDAVPLIADIDPSFVENGTVKRQILAAAIAQKPQLLRVIEELIHPLVTKDRKQFLERARIGGHALVVVDIPLLLERGFEHDVDVVLVVTAPAQIQEDRVLRRPGMTKEKLEMIRSRQMSSDKKVKSAHIVFDTSRGLDELKQDVKSLIRSLST